jgi:hypothetical protein
MPIASHNVGMMSMFSVKSSTTPTWSNLGSRTIPGIA